MSTVVYTLNVLFNKSNLFSENYQSTAELERVYKRFKRDRIVRTTVGAIVDGKEVFNMPAVDHTYIDRILDLAELAVEKVIEEREGERQSSQTIA